MQSIQAIAGKILDFALPPRCAGCGEIVTQANSFCLTCWQKIKFLEDAGCNRCGVPLEALDLTCGQCLINPPDHDGARAAIIYGEVARNVVTRHKYGRRIGLARIMANGMARHLRGREDALLVPVPLHRWRLWSRGFNQSLLIAQGLSRTSGNSILADPLIRTRPTPPLKGMGPTERARTVKGAFRVNPKHALGLVDRHIILIDDVCTTGATASACAKALKSAGAVKVELLCWARAVKDGGLEFR